MLCCLRCGYVVFTLLHHSTSYRHLISRTLSSGTAAYDVVTRPSISLRNSTHMNHPPPGCSHPKHRHLFTDCSTWDDPHTTGPRGFNTNGQGPCPMRQTLNAFAMRTPEGYKALQEYRALSARSEEARSLNSVMEVAAAGAWQQVTVCVQRRALLTVD